MTKGAEDRAGSVTIWMPLLIRDHKAVASTLNHTEHSAYVYLLLHLWLNGGEVPDDNRRLAREVRMSIQQWRKVRDAVLETCVVADGKISHPDMIVEYQKAKSNRAQKIAAGKASAAARAAAKEGNGRSTSVGTGAATDVPTDVPTARQPRAGGGAGPSQGPSFDKGQVVAGPFGAQGAAR